MGSTTGPQAQAAEKVRAVIEPLLRAAGLVLEDVAVKQAGRRKKVTILLDTSLDGLDAADTRSRVPALSLDQVAEATRVVDDALESSDVLGSDPYVLEVSSPGVGRVLREPAQFRRNIGRLVEVTHRSDGATTSATGRLTSSGPDGIELVVPATKKQPERTLALRFEDIDSGRVQVEFTRADDTHDLDDSDADEPATGHEDSDDRTGHDGPDEEN